MTPIRIGNEIWRVIQVPPGHPSLLDRTNTTRLGTSDPVTRTINISSAVMPPLLDKVLLHEMAHAMMSSFKLLDIMPLELHDEADETIAQFFENHAVDMIVTASEALGRPLCIDSECLTRLEQV